MCSIVGVSQSACVSVCLPVCLERGESNGKVRLCSLSSDLTGEPVFCSVALLHWDHLAPR